LGVALDNLPLAQGKWEYSEVYRDTVVAKDWGLTPMEFWSKSPLDQAFMIVHTQSSGAMESFEQKQLEKKE
jgi:hypothetical protein